MGCRGGGPGANQHTDGPLSEDVRPSPVTVTPRQTRRDGFVDDYSGIRDHGCVSSAAAEMDLVGVFKATRISAGTSVMMASAPWAR